MSLTPSKMLPLGTKAPYFELINPVSSKQIRLNDSKGEQGTVIMFICNHCPFVKYVNNELVAIANEYLNKGIGLGYVPSNMSGFGEPIYIQIRKKAVKATIVKLTFYKG